MGYMMNHRHGPIRRSVLGLQPLYNVVFAMALIMSQLSWATTSPVTIGGPFTLIAPDGTTVTERGPLAFFHPALTRARGSMFTHFTPADLVAILNIPRLQTLPNSFKILREYRLSVVALVFSR